MIDYLKIFACAANCFPCLDNEIQGVYRIRQPDGSARFHTYVIRE